jgi:hypothetical protein
MSSSNPPNSGDGPAAAKKRKLYEPPPAVITNESTAADLRVLHQNVNLSFSYSPSSNWHCQGTTTLYVIDEAPVPTGKIALHLRRTCQIQSLKVETVARVRDKITFATEQVSTQFMDQLANVLIKPPEAYSKEDYLQDSTTTPRYAGDAQCSRGASGMMTGLRVASIASNMGELRLIVSVKPKIRLGRATPEEQPIVVSRNNITKDEAFQCWSRDLKKTDGATAVQELQSQLLCRSSESETRIQSISNLLSTATTVDKAIRAFKITINYTIPLQQDDPVAHLGGIHFHTNSNNTPPHVYTTVGVVGDHEGPRNWLPCLDSASTKHRASTQIAIQVTAPMREGLSTVGCGQDFGASKTFLHDADFTPMAVKILGSQHVNWAQRSLLKKSSAAAAAASSHGAPHVIPPDAPNSIDSIYATHVWCSNAWTPAPSRSLGFAIGPFKVLEDPEYFSVEEEEEEDDDAPEVPEEEEKASLEEELEALEAARRNGEGIRQVYFAPLFQRKKLHENADMSLLPSTDITLQALSSAQLEQAEALDKAVTSATAGVPHRALSLFRDIIALPAYRTTSYTQIWIPDAVHGGSTSGALHCCPEVLINPFLGGAIMDSRLLPPPKSRLPYHAGGRVLQFLQARCAIRGWITAALPMGGQDDVGYGYIFSVIESFLMSLYERGHGAYGEGGAKGSVLFAKRYAVSSGLNSSNLDFLPVVNIEDSEFDMIGGIVGAIPTEDRNNDQIFRTASNGTESHSSARDEYSVRQVLISDIVENLERGTDKDKNVPLPSFGWTGSYLSLSFLSSTASSSSELGCGAVELAHPVGGLLYRAVKSEVFRRITEGRAGIANLVRVIRAGFIAAHLGDLGETKLSWGDKIPKRQKDSSDKKKEDAAESKAIVRPPFVICVDKLLSKGGFTHTLFTSGIRILAGPIREAHLRGTLVDVERNVRSNSTNRQFVEPEGYPNSFVRGASMPYLRVGAHVEPAGADAGGPGGPGVKGIQLHVMVEPAIPDGGISYSGPVTLRVVENEGQLREFVKVLNNGARADWGPLFLHAKPVTTAKDQSNASGVIEASSSSKDKKEKASDKVKEKDKQGDKSVLAAVAGGKVFNENILHCEGYQAIELVRLTNRSPLLWVRVDPQGLYAGKVSIFQPDACLAEMLFHDGDAAAQVEAVRALAERPLRIQGSVKITTVHNVHVSELPVRLLGDCLRGAPALHGDLPHTPVVRAQAALGIGQWQNNKAPPSKDSVDTEAWIGVNLLMQYFKERYYKNGMIMPVKFSRLVIKKNEAEAGQSTEGAPSKERESDDYVYLDAIRDDEKPTLVAGAEDVDAEEDEEHRVRSSVIFAIAAVRAQDGMTPSVVLKFLSAVLEAGDVSMVGTMDSQEAETVGTRITTHHEKGAETEQDHEVGLHRNAVAKLQYIPSIVIADALLGVCSINNAPSIILDPTTGKPVQKKKTQHPVQPLLVASRRWLEWELYRETIRGEMNRESQSGVGGNCYDSVAACGVAAVSTLAILQQVTTDQAAQEAEKQSSPGVITGAKFYMNIFDEEPRRPDVTRAACAQAVACVCCAADRFESPTAPLGLLTALEYILQKTIDPVSSPGLRQTLALLMLDVCTGKVSSMQRVGVVGARSDLCNSGARFYGGPLGATNGNDNGSALLMSVNAATNPVANAVNDGARRGLRFIGRAGHPRDETKDEITARVAKFATVLWRTINGHRVPTSTNDSTDFTRDGVCANDGILRCSLLALWQWIWPKACYAIRRVHSWQSHEETPRYKALGADKVLKVYEEETEAASKEEKLFDPLNKIVNAEIDRQAWRGDMVTKAYEHTMEKKGASKDDNSIGDLLPPILRDNAFKQGGWVTSTSRQRRAMQLDGGMAVTKIRLTVKGSD